MQAVHEVSSILVAPADSNFKSFSTDPKPILPLQPLFALTSWVYLKKQYTQQITKCL